MQIDIESQRKLFLGILRRVKREGIEELIKYLETSDFFIAPASIKFHGSFKGGLAWHSLNVYNALQYLYENLKSGTDYVLPHISEDSLIIGSLLHDICKTNSYIEGWKNQKVYSDAGSKQDAAGRYDWETVATYERKPILPMGHGGKSVFILQQFIKLTAQEALAIFWHMGAFDTSDYMTYNELGESYKTNLLAFLLNQADMVASYILENENYLPISEKAN